MRSILRAPHDGDGCRAFHGARHFGNERLHERCEREAPTERERLVGTGRERAAMIRTGACSVPTCSNAASASGDEKLSDVRCSQEMLAIDAICPRRKRLPRWRLWQHEALDERRALLGHSKADEAEVTGRHERGESRAERFDHLGAGVGEGAKREVEVGARCRAARARWVEDRKVGAAIEGVEECVVMFDGVRAVGGTHDPRLTGRGLMAEANPACARVDEGRAWARGKRAVKIESMALAKEGGCVEAQCGWMKCHVSWSAAAGKV